MTTSRLRFPAGLTLAAAALGVFFWLTPEPARTPAARQTLTIGVPNLPHAMPVIVADELGLFRAEGLAVTTRPYASGKAAMDGLFAGEVELAMAAETPIVLLSFRRKDFAVLATVSHTFGDNKVSARRDRGIRAVPDLRGRRIGVIAGTTSQFFLYALLADHGLGMADVREVPMSGAEMAGRLAKAEVDAVVAFEPYAHQALQALAEGNRTSLTNKRVRTSFNLVAMRGLPARRADALVRLLRATDKAIEWSRGHRQEVASIMGRRLKMDPAATREALMPFEYELGLDQGLMMSLDEQARWAMATGATGAAALPNYLDYLDFSALLAAKPRAVTLIR